MRRFRRDETGAIAIIVALMLPFLIAGLALGAETGYWFMIQRQTQHAADVAAYSAAVRLADNRDQTEIREAATLAARNTGLPQTTGAVSVTFPAANRVRVVLTDTRERLFTRIFLAGPVILSAGATAEVRREDRGIPVCVLSMNLLLPSTLYMRGSTRIDVPNCNVEARSISFMALNMGGSSSMTAACVNLAGGRIGNTPVTTVCDGVRTYSTVRPLPQQLADLPVIANTWQVPTSYASNAHCNYAPTWIHPQYGVPMMRFQGFTNFSGTVTFCPGVYIFDLGMVSTSNRAVLRSAANPAHPDPAQRQPGVTFYLNGSVLSFHSNSNFDLRGMRYGPFEDVVITDNRGVTSMQLHSVSGARMTGVIYLPLAQLSFSGGTGIDDGCFMLIADRFDFGGNALLSADCENSDFDLGTIGTGGGGGEVTIRLVE